MAETDAPRLVVAPDEWLFVEEKPAILNADLPSAPDTPLIPVELAFNGAWVPDEDPLKIGRNHFARMENLRYTNTGIEGVQGSTRITTAALANPRIRSGIQLIKKIAAASSSFVLVQAWNAGLTASAVYPFTPAIPGTGIFGSSLFTDTTGAGLGRFAHGPDGTVIYANGRDTCIWGTAEHRCAAFVNYDDVGAAFRYDITERIQNNLSDAPNRFTLVRDAASDIYVLVGATRPLQGIKFYVGTANTGASTSTVEYWNGSAWTAVAGFSDGTAVGGVTLAQTGTMSFTSTVTTAKVQFLDEKLLYYYRVRAGATGTPDATITVYQATVDAPFQPIVDIWDGVERTPILVFQNETGVDYTTEAAVADFQQGSFTDAGLVRLGGLTGGQAVIIGFQERTTALKWLIVDPAGTVATVTVNYWNGTAWTSVGTVTDSTLVAGRSLGQSGTMSWNAPAATSEFTQTLNGIRGYHYQLLWSAGLTGDTDIDRIAGIPAQRWNADSPIVPYKFPLFYQNRVMLCGRLEGNEGNRIDYSASGNTPDVYNGEDSSAEGKALFIGDAQDLTAGVELSNRFTGQLNSFALLLKARQTWLLTGSTPEDFKEPFKISDAVGCPAPLTLVVADVSFAIDRQAVRNTAMWVSHRGPVMFDGGVLVPMRFTQPDGIVSSVEAYFNPNDTRFITVSSMENARGWFDATWSEYNILLPTAGSTTCNVWLCCDLKRQKWFQKVPVVFPQAAFVVIDTAGGQYTYCGVDGGHLIRLENGTTWEDGSSIVHTWRSGDMLPTTSVWDTTILRYVKLGVVREAGASATVTLSHAGDGSSTFAALATLDLVGGSARYRKVTQPVNRTFWSHSLELTVTTNDKTRAPQLLGLGCLFRIERKELT